jgi:hypothetical protein
MQTDGGQIDMIQMVDAFLQIFVVNVQKIVLQKNGTTDLNYVCGKCLMKYKENYISL